MDAASTPASNKAREGSRKFFIEIGLLCKLVG
jgi:hypothetical protein